MAEKILAVVAAKDRLIASQAMVMDLAKGVLGSKDGTGAVRTLVDTAYKVVDADRINLYLVSKERLICHVSPDPESVGKELPWGSGMVGHVVRTGEVLNIEDAYSRPDLFDVSQDLLTGYTTRSVLTLPLRDRDDRVIGALQAVNKSGSADEPEKFEPHDERNLDLLLTLTSHQLHFSELTLQRQRATEWAESMLTLVEAISAERETGGAALALAHAAAGLLHCRRALVFLRDASSNSLVCWAAVTSATSAGGERGLRVEMSEAVLGEVASSGMPILVDRENHASELAALHRRLQPCFGTETLPEACSALCAPLLDKHAGEAVGVLVAFDRLAALGDAEEPLLRRSPTPPSSPEAGDRSQGACLGHRRFSAARAMRSLLRDDSRDLHLPPDEAAGPFHQSDLATVGVLSHSAANILRTAGLYEREMQLNRRLGAMMELITESRNLAEQNKTSELVAHVSGLGRKIFDCDRCTFFTIDNFNQQLVGFYVLEGASSGERLQELRVPMKGIVGHVANTKEALNIKDAWNDERFNNEMDTSTGYKTKTILCAPVTAANGRMVGVLQCINKNGGRVFGSDDLEMLSMVTISLSDAIQAALLDNSYDSFIRSNGSISTEVKDMFRFFEKGATAEEMAPSPKAQPTVRRSRSKMSTVAAMVLVQPKLKRMLTRSRTTQTFLDSMESWDHDITPLETDHELFMRSVRQTFDRLCLSEPFSAAAQKLGPFLEALKGKYNSSVSYHSWRHAMSTWHAIFLLLGSPAFWGLLPSEELLALLLAAFGHDVEHPGTSNNFQVNSTSSLAMRYNDISVLENHHAAVTSALLEEERVVADLGSQPRHRIRQVIITSILHTDMIKHKDNLAWLETCTADLPSHRENKQPLDPDSGLKLGSALLHCADLVHPAMPWRVHKQMSILIAEEFYAQYQEETRLGLPTLPFMGKDPKVLPDLAPIQVGFLQFVAQPLWSALSFFAREELLNEVVLNVTENKDRWKRLGEGEDIPDEQPFNSPPQRPAPRKERPSPGERTSSPTKVEFKEGPEQESK